MNKSVILLPILTTVLILTSAADVGNDLIGWWKFDETSGSTAADYSGNGYTATVNKTNVWDAGGYDGGCLNEAAVFVIGTMFFNKLSGHLKQLSPKNQLASG